MSFLSDLVDVADEDLTAARVMEFYRGRASDEVFGVNSKYDKGRLAAAGFYKRSGLANLPQVSRVFFVFFFFCLICLRELQSGMHTD